MTNPNSDILRLAENCCIDCNHDNPDKCARCEITLIKIICHNNKLINETLLEENNMLKKILFESKIEW